MTNSSDRDDNRKNFNDSPQQTQEYNFYNALKEDTTKIVNEIAKTQPTVHPGNFKSSDEIY